MNQMHTGVTQSTCSCPQAEIYNPCLSWLYPLAGQKILLHTSHTTVIILLPHSIPCKESFQPVCPRGNPSAMCSHSALTLGSLLSRPCLISAPTVPGVKSPEVSNLRTLWYITSGKSFSLIKPRVVTAGTNARYYCHSWHDRRDPQGSSGLTCDELTGDLGSVLLPSLQAPSLLYHSPHF